MGAFNKLFGRLRLTSDVNVATQTTTVIQTDTTNSNLAIVPNGTGAITASIPDGTATGGNARGNNAVDLQSVRTANTQVVSGARSVIVGGQNNSVGAGDSIIVGGNGNTLNKATSFIGGGQSNSMSSTFGSHGVIVGGQGNVMGSRTHAVIGGGQNNSCLGGWNTISGGFNNSTNDSTYNTVGGGSTNSAVDGYSTTAGGLSNNANAAYGTISGGQSNTASTGTHATVVGGQSNTASSAHATVIGGSSNTASGGLSVAGGTGVIASGSNSFAYGSATTRATASGAIALGSGMNCTAEGAKGLSGNSTVSASFAAAIGGIDNLVAASQSVAIGSGHSITAGANCSVVVGLNGAGYLYNQFVQGGATGNSRTNQNSTVNAWRYDTLNSAATTVLSLDGTGTTNLIIPNGNNRMWNVTIKYVAVVTTITGTATGVTVGDTKSQNIEIGFKEVNGVSSLVGSGVYSIPQEDASMGSASLIPTAGASQQLALTFTAPTFTGGGSVTCRVVAKVELVEVAY
jgi:hypothetical protein